MHDKRANFRTVPDPLTQTEHACHSSGRWRGRLAIRTREQPGLQGNNRSIKQSARIRYSHCIFTYSHICCFLCITWLESLHCSAYTPPFMSESPRPSKVPRRGHVTLTERSLINYVSEGCVLVGHPLRGDAAGASGLLSGLSATEGLASLPHDLSSDDVQLWQAARLLGIQPSTDELVTILKVLSAVDAQQRARRTTRTRALALTRIGANHRVLL